jgi:nucleotide-binding universal stress UspA family protein
MKNILITLDYDPTAQKVAEIGYSLAENRDTAITLLHVIADPSYYGSSVYDPVMGFGGYTDLDFLGPDIVAELKKTSLDFLATCKKHLGNDGIATMVKEGSIAATILEVADEIHADAIVMGSHSKRWLENLLMGSVTEHVLHHSIIPLLIIPTKKIAK